jgi:hypothetical protein
MASISPREQAFPTLPLRVFSGCGRGSPGASCGMCAGWSVARPANRSGSVRDTALRARIDPLFTIQRWSQLVATVSNGSQVAKRVLLPLRFASGCLRLRPLCPINDPSRAERHAGSVISPIVRTRLLGAHALATVRAALSLSRLLSQREPRRADRRRSVAYGRCSGTFGPGSWASHVGAPSASTRRCPSVVPLSSSPNHTPTSPPRTFVPASVSTTTT